MLSFPKEVDFFLEETGSEEKGNQETPLFFDIFVNYPENTAASQWERVEAQL